MGTKLSHKLLDLGFFSALGTSEHPSMSGIEHHVGTGTPFTQDYNNGVRVVYDEDGRPWISHRNLVPHDMSASEFMHALGELNEVYHLVRGANVPHSNDGGYFIREILSKVRPMAYQNCI